MTTFFLFFFFLTDFRCSRVVQAGVRPPSLHAAAGTDPGERDEDEHAYGQTSTISLLTQSSSSFQVCTHTFKNIQYSFTFV